MMASMSLLRMAESSVSPGLKGLGVRVGVGEGRTAGAVEGGGCPVGDGDEAAGVRRGVVVGRVGRRVLEGRLREGLGR